VRRDTLDNIAQIHERIESRRAWGKGPGGPFGGESLWCYPARSEESGTGSRAAATEGA
jgi:hypothetical protein